MGIILVKRNNRMRIDIGIILICNLSKCMELCVITYHQTVQMLERTI